MCFFLSERELVNPSIWLVPRVGSFSLSFDRGHGILYGYPSVSSVRQIFSPAFLFQTYWRKFWITICRPRLVRIGINFGLTYGPRWMAKFYPIRISRSWNNLIYSKLLSVSLLGWLLAWSVCEWLMVKDLFDHDRFQISLTQEIIKFTRHEEILLAG